MYLVYVCVCVCVYVCEGDRNLCGGQSSLQAQKRGEEEKKNNLESAIIRLVGKNAMEEVTCAELRPEHTDERQTRVIRLQFLKER